jgi:hypothetical protein
VEYFSISHHFTPLLVNNKEYTKLSQAINEKIRFIPIVDSGFLFVFTDRKVYIILTMMKFLHRISIGVALLGLMPVALLSFELTEFSAMPAENAIELTWRISDSGEVLYVIIQRSQDEMSWEDVATVYSQSGQDIYSYRDNAVVKNDRQLAGTYYYRLVFHLVNGENQVSASIMAQPRYSGVYRTWGSLKALFR